MSTGTSNFFTQLAFSILLVFAVRELGMSAGLIGLAFALGNVGWLLGALFSSRLQSRFGVGPISIAAMALTPVSLLLTAIAPASFPLPFLVAAGILGGIGAVVYNIAQVSLRQAITPERMQGRMNSVMRFIVWGTIPLGALIGGALGSTVGLRETLFIGAAGSVLALVPLLLSPIRSVREIPTQVEDVEPTIAAGEGGLAGAVAAGADTVGATTERGPPRPATRRCSGRAGSLAAQRLPEAVVGRDDRSIRLAGHGPGVAARRRDHARRERVHGLGAGRRRVRAVPPHLPPGRRVGRRAPAGRS